MSESAALERLNGMARAEFAAALDGIYEHSPWVADGAWAERPFHSLAALKRAMVQVVRSAAQDSKLALLRAHPDLAGRAMKRGELTPDSRDEQSRAGLTACSPAEFERLATLNAAYGSKFGFPFILAVRGPRGTGLTPSQVLVTLERRLSNPHDFEFAEALRNVHRIAEIRLDERVGTRPQRGERVWDWAESLAAFSDPGFAEHGQLTVCYLTDAHRACSAQLMEWMREECGFDEVERDAVGNVVGIYHGAEPGAARLLTGSHFDTVRNGGRYDGRLGILVPMACVQMLAAAGRRLPFGIEVVAFAEEEGQRFKATFLGSGALVGQFDRRWLEQVDADGISMRDAMHAAGLDIERIGEIRRDPSRYLGFVEVHIEQGPVLDALDMPLGIVTSINGGVRFVGEAIGMASHAGTTPMGARRDAALAVAELALALERRASAEPDLVGTVGVLEVPAGSINVVPGRCRFSLDIRATTDAVRDACVADVLAQWDAICTRRGIEYRLEESMRAAAAPSDPRWQSYWEAAVSALGLPVHRMPSGAGHDAMKIHEVMPQAMLFVRGGNAGISHNPLETITAHDAELCVRAFDQLLEGLARTTPS